MGLKATCRQSEGPSLLSASLQGSIFGGSCSNPTQGCMWERVCEELGSYFVNFWLRPAKLVHVAVRESESGPEPQPAGSSSPLRSPKVGKNLGQVFRGLVLRLRSQQCKSKTRRYWSCICKSSCCGSFLIFKNNSDVLKITFYKNRRASSSLSHSTKRHHLHKGDDVSVHTGQIGPKCGK